MPNFITLINVKKKSAIDMGVKIFNSHPLELKTTDNFKVFKKKLKNYLLHSSFYSLQVFLTSVD
jgi:hypothetical protein